jgi:hypothetical protein
MAFIMNPIPKNAPSISANGLAILDGRRVLTVS